MGCQSSKEEITETHVPLWKIEFQTIMNSFTNGYWILSYKIPIDCCNYTYSYITGIEGFYKEQLRIFKSKQTMIIRNKNYRPQSIYDIISKNAY